MPNPSELERRGLRVGTLTFSTTQGLAILAKSFFDNGVITDALVIRHGRRPENEDWFPDQPRCGDIRRVRQLEDFCRSMDVMIFLETPFVWNLIPFCKKLGIPTILMVMHECMPKELPAVPDAFFCPSLLDMECYCERRDIAKEARPFETCYGIHGALSYFTPVPVQVPWRQRIKAEVFVHNAGHGGLRGRNGTRELLDAIHLVKSDAQFIIRSQDEEAFRFIERDLKGDSRVTVSCGTKDYNELWNSGDVLIFPEKFNGLSLPLQEARAAGMLVMAGRRFPMDTWLPREPLIPVHSYRRSCVAARCLDYDEAVIRPEDIARKIDEYYGRDISDYSMSGKTWAESMSWKTLKPKYLEVLTDLTRK